MPGFESHYGEEGTSVRTEWGDREVVMHLGENEADEEREEEEPLALLLLHVVHHARHVFPKMHHHLSGTPLGEDTGTLLPVQSRQPHPLVAPSEPPRAHPRLETRDLFHTEAGRAEHQASLETFSTRRRDTLSIKLACAT